MLETHYKHDASQNSNFSNTTLPKGLNILTILTIIWCCISGLFTVLMPWYVNFMKNIMDKSTSTEGLSSKKIEELEKSRHALELLNDNLIPLLLIGVIGVVLCLVGAILMRKLKKDGFIYYVAGQILPFVAGLILLGTDQYNGVISYLFAVIPFVFIFLYWRQRRYLTN